MGSLPPFGSPDLYSRSNSDCSQISKRIHIFCRSRHAPRNRTILGCRSSDSSCISRKKSCLPWSESSDRVSSLTATSFRRHRPAHTSPYAPAPRRSTMCRSDLRTDHLYCCSSARVRIEPEARAAREAECSGRSEEVSANVSAVSPSLRSSAGSRWPSPGRDWRERRGVGALERGGERFGRGEAGRETSPRADMRASMSAAAAETIHWVLVRGVVASATDDEPRDMRPGDAPRLEPYECLPEHGLPLARLNADRRPAEARWGDEQPCDAAADSDEWREERGHGAEEVPSPSAEEPRDSRDSCCDAGSHGNSRAHDPLCAARSVGASARARGLPGQRLRPPRCGDGGRKARVGARVLAEEAGEGRVVRAAVGGQVGRDEALVHVGGGGGLLRQYAGIGLQHRHLDLEEGRKGVGETRSKPARGGGPRASTSGPQGWGRGKLRNGWGDWQLEGREKRGRGGHRPGRRRCGG
eukprot:scaffold1395_cov87-Isochrysis_galbana.AAC.1